MSTISSPNSKDLLEKALTSLLTAVSPDSEPPVVLYKLSYDQHSGGSTSTSVDGNVISFPVLPLDLAFNDNVMAQVKTAWDALPHKSDAEGAEGEGYMNFEDREGAGDEDSYE